MSDEFTLLMYNMSRKVKPMKDTTEEAMVFIVASPSHVLRGIINELNRHLPPEAIIVSVTKGIENDTLKLPSQIFEEILPEGINLRTVYLSGPTFAKEVAGRLPVAATIAAVDTEIAEYIQNL